MQVRTKTLHARFHTLPDRNHERELHLILDESGVEISSKIRYVSLRLPCEALLLGPVVVMLTSCGKAMRSHVSAAKQ